jgi:hypothetical protein
VYPDPKHWLKTIPETKMFRKNEKFRENFRKNENFRENFRENPPIYGAGRAQKKQHYIWFLRSAYRF